MENFAIQSLVKWLIIKLIPRFIRTFHVTRTRDCKATSFSLKIKFFRPIFGPYAAGEGSAAGIRPCGKESPPVPQSGTKGRRVQRLNAQQRARADATESPDGQAYGRAAMAPRPFRIRRSGREKRAEAQRAAKHPGGRRREPGRTPQSIRTERDSGGIRPDSGGRIVPGLPVRDGRCAAADGCRGAAATPPRAPRAAPRPPGRPQSGPRNTPDRGSFGRYSRSSPPGRDALR